MVTYENQAAMKLQRLVEMIRQDRSGAEEWPVLVSTFKENAMGEWQELDGTRQPIGSVFVAGDDVLLIGNDDCVPLSVANLEQELTGLPSNHAEFLVEYCGDTPIEIDGDGGLFHIDVPIGGAGRDEKSKCYLVICLSAE